MTQMQLSPAPRPPYGTEIELDGRVYVVTEPTDPGTDWAMAKSGLTTPVYLIERDGDGEWAIEGAAYVAEYGTVLA